MPSCSRTISTTPNRRYGDALHVFDANTLRNLGLVGALELLPRTLDGTLFIGSVVRDELRRGAKRFPVANAKRLVDPKWVEYALRFQQLDARLAQLGFTTIEVSSASTRAGEFAFLACLVDEWVMEEGEAEAFTVAAYRGHTLYSDEWKVMEEARMFGEGNFPCPFPGEAVPTFDSVTVHSTAWILLEAVERDVVTLADAERAYEEMRDIWQRHPQRTLSQLRDGDGHYW